MIQNLALSKENFSRTTNLNKLDTLPDLTNEEWRNRFRKLNSYKPRKVLDLESNRSELKKSKKDIDKIAMHLKKLNPLENDEASQTVKKLSKKRDNDIRRVCREIGSLAKTTRSPKDKDKAKQQGYKDGYVQLRFELIKHAARMIPGVVRKSYPIIKQNNLNSKDFYSEGYYILMRACDNYDPDGEASFPNYAITTLKRELVRWVQRENKKKQRQLEYNRQKSQEPVKDGKFASSSPPVDIMGISDREQFGNFDAGFLKETFGLSPREIEVIQVKFLGEKTWTGSKQTKDQFLKSALFKMRLALDDQFKVLYSKLKKGEPPRYILDSLKNGEASTVLSPQHNEVLYRRWVKKERVKLSTQELEINDKTYFRYLELGIRKLTQHFSNPI